MKITPVNSYSNKAARKGAAAGAIIAGGATAVYACLDKGCRKDIVKFINKSKANTGSALSAYKAFAQAGALVLCGALVAGSLAGKIVGKIKEHKQAKIAERQQAEIDAQLIRNYEEEEANKYDCPYCGA